MADTAPASVLLLNHGCHPDCALHLSAGAPLCAPHQIEGALDAVAPGRVYLGAEAFADRAALVAALGACRRRGVRPILLTSGGFVESAEQVGRLFDELLSAGAFTICLVLDEAHCEALGAARRGALIEAIRRRVGVPEAFYLLPPGRSLPASLLAEDAVNRLFTLRISSAGDLPALLAREGIAAVDPGALPERRAVERAPLGDARQPLRFHTLIFQTTYFCNARCAHCYTSCGPEAPPARLPVDRMKRILDQAAALPNLEKRCHLSGGEPTLYWDELLDVLAYARQKGFVSSLVTNGYWARGPLMARERATQLASVGVGRVELSTDAMHDGYIPEAAASGLLTACKGAGIEVDLRVTTTRENRADAALARFSPDDLRDVCVALAQVTPIGRARDEIPADTLWTDPGLPLGACFASLHLTVTPTGDVFPCCSGSELSPALTLGNCLSRPLAELVDAAWGNLVVRTLVHAGPAHIAGILQEAGRGDLLEAAYTDYCHLCNRIFSDPELVAVVRQGVEDRLQSTVRASLGARP